jgi:hypothetical protein
MGDQVVAALGDGLRSAGRLVSGDSQKSWPIFLPYMLARDSLAAAFRSFFQETRVE